METLTISLPDDLKDDLQKPGEELSKPVGDIVRESIRRCVALVDEIARGLREKIGLPVLERWQGIAILSPRSFAEMIRSG